MLGSTPKGVRLLKGDGGGCNKIDVIRLQIQKNNGFVHEEYVEDFLIDIRNKLVNLLPLMNTDEQRDAILAIIGVF